MASRNLLKIDDLHRVFCWSWCWSEKFWVGLMSLVMFWMVYIGYVYLLKTVEFEGIKNPFKDRWHIWILLELMMIWTFLSEADVLGDLLDCLHQTSHLTAFGTFSTHWAEIPCLLQQQGSLRPLGTCSPPRRWETSAQIPWCDLLFKCNLGRWCFQITFAWGQKGLFDKNKEV